MRDLLTNVDSSTAVVVSFDVINFMGNNMRIVVCEVFAEPAVSTWVGKIR